MVRGGGGQNSRSPEKNVQYLFVGQPQGPDSNAPGLWMSTLKPALQDSQSRFFGCGNPPGILMPMFLISIQCNCLYMLKLI